MQLIQFDKAKQALQAASSFDEVKDIKDKAEALRIYMKQSGESLEMQNQCATIRLRAERRGGEMLKGMDKAKGAQGNPGGQGAKIVRSNDDTSQPTLSDIGISKSQSSRWQKIASIPEDTFEDYIAETCNTGKELTTATALKIAKSIIKEDVKPIKTKTDTNTDLNNIIKSGEKFGTIYADPPWSYSNQSTRAATDNHYSTMSVENIAALPIKEIAADDSHLHIWTTNAFLFDTKQVLEAWGFEYRSCFIWVKPQMGIGNYWRVSHEFLILGIRGKAKRFNEHDKMSYGSYDRTKHSKKPDEIADVITKVSPGPFIELFGRQKRMGWTVWGNEIADELF